MITPNQLKYPSLGKDRMITSFAVVFIIFCFNQIRGDTRHCEQVPTVYWESFSKQEKASVLKIKRIPKDIRELYEGLWCPSDDERSFRVLDSLIAPFNRGTQALYFFLFCKICEESDGALAEVLGEYCLMQIKSNPEYTLTYLYYNKDMLRCFVAYLRDDFFEDDPEEVHNEVFLDFVNYLKTFHFTDHRPLVVRRELLQSLLSFN